jgi:hypothetical protein
MTRAVIFVADAHRGDRNRFVVRADEILTAFLELEIRKNIIDTVDRCLPQSRWR